MALRNMEISLEGTSIKVVNLNTSSPNIPEYYNTANVKSIVALKGIGIGTYQSNTDNPLMPYPKEDKLEVQINFINQNENPPIKFDIQYISNQPTWTADYAGLLQAAYDINQWIATSVVTQLTDAEITSAWAIDADEDYVWVEVEYLGGVKTYTYKNRPGGATVTPTQPIRPVIFPSNTNSISGAQTNKLTVDGTLSFIFDADSVLIENFGTGEITCVVDGVLGGTIIVKPNTFKDISHVVATMTEVAVTGIVGGDVLITYSRGK
jgi:hypothetical protein